MTDSASKRINARLDGELAHKVAYLRAQTNKTTTEVVRESIERYYEAVERRGASAREIFARAGFIGCADGARDLSRRYKQLLLESLSKKTPL